MSPARRFSSEQPATFTVTPGDVTSRVWVPEQEHVMVPVQEKVEHVRQARQDRHHTCHWPGCLVLCPPAMWGCKAHWFRLPKRLRDAIWNEYVPGQEQRMDPSSSYLLVAREVQEWIEANG